jgi:hypothetical protein
MAVLLDLNTAAEYLSMTPAALRELVRRKQIPFRYQGTKLVFPIEDLIAWVRALPGLSVSAALRNLPVDFTHDFQTTPVDLSDIQVKDDPGDSLPKRPGRPHILPKLRREH